MCQTILRIVCTIFFYLNNLHSLQDYSMNKLANLLPSPSHGSMRLCIIIISSIKYERIEVEKTKRYPSKH